MNTEHRQADLPMQTRAAPVQSFDREARTVDLIFSTGAAVRRARWVGWDTRIPYDETLIVSRSAVNMERLDAGGPVLDSHNTWSTRAQVAVVEKAWIEGGNAWARVRFPSEGIDEGADRMFGLVADGIVRNVSVGYSQDEVRVVEPAGRNDVEQRIVERWTPHEISFVTVGADPGAQVRSQDARPDGNERLFPAVIITTRTKEIGMSDAPTAPAPEASGTPAPETRAAAPAVDPAANPAVATELLAAERNRASEILSIGTRAGMAQDAIDTAVRAGETVADFRKRAFEHLAARTDGQGARTSLEVIRDETETRRRGMTEAITLAMRHGGNRIAARADTTLSDNGRRFIRHTVPEMAAETLGEREMPRNWAERQDMVERAFHTTSDFPLILSGAINTRLLASYEAAQPVYRRIAIQTQFADFRAHDQLRPGDFPMPQPLGQGGEMKFGTFGEKKETIAVAPYAVQFALTRQLLVNDNLGAIDQMMGQYGTTIALFEEITFFAMKGVASGAGPTLLETARPVFNTTDGTLAASATAITNAALGLGRAALRKQKRMDGNAMGLGPSILLVSPDKETEAETILANITPQQATNVNIFSGRLELVVAGQLTGNAWELYTSPSVGANWAWGLLDGYAAPRLRMENKFGVQGVGVSLEHDFGCGAIDFRFGYRNAGA